MRFFTTLRYVQNDSVLSYREVGCWWLSHQQPTSLKIPTIVLSF